MSNTQDTTAAPPTQAAAQPATLQAEMRSALSRPPVLTPAPATPAAPVVEVISLQEAGQMAGAMVFVLGVMALTLHAMGYAGY
ncbi:hypothetical protein [Acetobacter vaccinii]|uniref:Uncharacterized protein n=1 Tax=Acetobacter vaccinii TaxID=2592655 RepID=A0A5C1YMC2_9PROT|nr:hypothetical protein [Acetobacter vaccinii]QEO17121.1 hypothetical protein FLP30_04695 [Acetobacter vaccinii]